MLYQQGDVLIETVEKIPAETPERKDKVLFYGEATGHAHRVTGAARVYESDGIMTDPGLYIEAPEPTEVVHEEHNVIRLPAGRYRVRKVQEFDHFANRPRWVMD